MIHTCYVGNKEPKKNLRLINEKIVSIENFEKKFKQIGGLACRVDRITESSMMPAHIFLFGHGGNLGVADHAAIDMSRLTDKNVIAPGSGVLATSLFQMNHLRLG